MTNFGTKWSEGRHVNCELNPRKARTWSDEQKLIQSERMKNSWTEDRKKNYSEYCKKIGRKPHTVDEEKRRVNISKARKGMKFSEEHCRALSISHKGVPTGTRNQDYVALREASIKVRKGIPLSEAHRKAISVANKGRMLSEETKLKQSVSRVKLIVARGDAHIGKGMTNIERIVRDRLIKNNVKFMYGYPLENRAIYDFLLPEYNSLIECDGEYWHSNEKAKKRDDFKNKLAEKHGYELIRLKEKDIKSGGFNLPGVAV